MKILKDISEEEVTQIFIVQQLESPRFTNEIQKIIKDLSVDQKIIDNPNFNDQNENKLRHKIRQTFGGSEDTGSLFENFPKTVSWKRAILTKKDLMRVKYINYDYWIELSNHTRLIQDGASSVRKGTEVFDQSNQNFWNVLEALKTGTKFPEPLLVAKSPSSDLVVVEGHLRLTVYLLDPTYTPNEINAIIGFSENFQNWDMY